MEIKQYDSNARVEFIRFIENYKAKRRLNTLNKTSLIKGKKIFLVLEKGFFKKYKIIGYAIVNEELHAIYIANQVSQKYAKDRNTIYISDFMIDYLYRNQGKGKTLANYILNDIYKDKDIILQPKCDGSWFWKKFGFVNDETSKHITWVLRRTKD